VTDQYLVTDTHPLIWYMAKQDAKLPRKVFAAFKSAQEGTGTHIWVPVAVVLEISQLMRRTRRVIALGSLEELLRENFYFRSIIITDFETEDLLGAHSLNFSKDPFDSLIVATAQRLELPLMTADEEIINSNSCKVFWR
jgi:PIN domain nuclease of toxin-antitoxin system